ncbi:hypothetical protein D3C81_441980 [compost metagenome]
MSKVYEYDPTLWVGYTRKVAESLGYTLSAAEYRVIMQMYIKKATVEEVVAKLETPTNGVDLSAIEPEAFDMRQHYIDTYGSVLNWALDRVVNNWRIRKRLPRLTAKAKALGLIEEETVDE